MVSKVILSVTPEAVKDIKQLQAYFEMQGYNKELKRYRPFIKIQTMIDAEKRQPSRSDIALKKKAVIRDWFKLVLWYVRLRKASKGEICS